MFRHTIHADVDSDVDGLVADLHVRATKAGMPEVSVALLTSRAQATLQGLLQRGRTMGGSGSTMSAEQVLKDETYLVRITFGSGTKQTLIQRATAWLRGR